MAYASARLNLPLLQAGQAQKEFVHNEALIAIETVVQAVAETFGDNAPPSEPMAGKCWIIGSAPTGDWAGRAAALAMWSDGGWRFTAAFEGMAVWVTSASLIAHYVGGGWSMGEERAIRLVIGGVQVVGAQQPPIANPTGGSLIDTEARAAITAINLALRSHGLIAT